MRIHSTLGRVASRLLLLVYWTQSTLALALVPPARATAHESAYDGGSHPGHDDHRSNERGGDDDRHDGRDRHRDHGHHDEGRGDDHDDDQSCDDDQDDHEKDRDDRDHRRGSRHRSCRESLQDGKVPQVRVAKKELWPPDHRLVNVGLRVDEGEACCGRAGVSLAVFSDEPADGLGDGDTPIDARIDAPELYLRQERGGQGDGRVYLIAATATYQGVSSTRCTTVVVPKSNSKRDRDRVKRQACAARDFCGVAGGPPGFHLVGSGPLDGANQAPAVDAGSEQAIDLGATAALRGTVTDDGLPSGSLTLQWSQVEGPGDVSFTPPDAAETTASFSAAGSYRLRLTAGDSELQAYDEVVVVVSAANTAPVVDAGPDLPLALPTTTTTLAGSVSDDGRPAGALSIGWSVVEGPGTVTFCEPDPARDARELRRGRRLPTAPHGQRWTVHGIRRGAR